MRFIGIRDGITNVNDYAKTSVSVVRRGCAFMIAHHLIVGVVGSWTHVAGCVRD